MDILHANFQIDYDESGADITAPRTKRSLCDIEVADVTYNISWGVSHGHFTKEFHIQKYQWTHI